ncbi:MAG: hypothetical protein K0M45_08995 [Candidatus Paracaedibacteraceae bacterium]|nr:hypothetical protein [Candidatus Paracaedibacteraceae bacterium]
MSLAEIPSKIIEKTEALTEKKLEIAAILTALIYCTPSQESVTEEMVLRTYFNVFNEIKKLTPPTLEKIKDSKSGPLYIKIILGSLIAFGLISLLVYLIAFYKF